MEFKVGDKVTVKHSENYMWTGPVCEVRRVYDSGKVSVKHPSLGVGAFPPEGLELVPKFQVGDEVRCTLKDGDPNPHYVCHQFFGQVGTVTGFPDVETFGDQSWYTVRGLIPVEFKEGYSGWNGIAPEDLQYVFQEGDIVRLNHNDEASGRWRLLEGSAGTVDRVDDGRCPTVWVLFDQLEDTVGCAESELDLVDRAPKSDAEQCCTANEEYKLEPAVGDRVHVQYLRPDGSPNPDTKGDGTIVEADLARIYPYRVKMDGTGELWLCYLKELTLLEAAPVTSPVEEDRTKTDLFGPSKPADMETTFPVDEPGHDYFSEVPCAYGFEASFVDGDFIALPYCRVVSVMKLLNGDVEVYMDDDYVITYPADALMSYCVPGEKWRRMVEVAA